MLHPTPSLRARILASFLLFGLLFTFVMLAFMVMAYEAGQEGALQKMLVEEVVRFQAERAVNPSAALPAGPMIRSYVGTGSMPPRYRDHLHRFEAEDYEVPLSEWDEIQLWQGTVEGLEEPLYVILDVGAMQDRALFGPNLLRAVLLAAGIVLLFALWLGWIVSTRLSRPLQRLSERVTRYDPSSEAFATPAEFGGGEVGLLAGAFAAMHDRTRRFVDREKQFTRNASHELRTPITVVRGAHGVLRKELPAPAPKVERALNNIEQASEEMGLAVEAFLWLAREESEPEREAVCRTGDLVRRCVDLHRPLLRDRAVRVEPEIHCETHADFPPHLFRIALSNLVQNAFQYTREGSVRVTLESEGVRVTDTGPGIPEPVLRHIGRPHTRGEDDCAGFGLGLSIVQRIADRCGWTFTLSPGTTGGTVAELRFGPPRSSTVSPT